MSKYDDDNYNAEARRILSLDGNISGAQTSVQAAAASLDRRTFMTGATVKDFNIVIRTGDTSTGTMDSNRWRVGIGKSLAGTGAVAIFGSAVIGTQADLTVVDASVTETNFAVGDDIVLQILAGTSLAAGAMVFGQADVSYVERFDE